MASTDRPRGFMPDGRADGAPWNSMVKTIANPTAADIFMNDPIKIDSSAQPLSIVATGDLVMGVAVGFGKNGTASGVFSGPNNAGFAFNPSNLESGARYFDTSTAGTHTEWTVFYVPAWNALFEAQQATGTDIVISLDYDITIATGSTTTGVSAMEINDASTTTGGFQPLQSARRPDTSATDTNADWLGRFTNQAYVVA